VPELASIVERTVLDRSSGVPLHVQIREALRGLCGSEVLPWGATVPPEGELARELSVSRMTLRQALASLETEGLLERRQGVGTVVRFPKFRHETQRLTSFSDDMTSRGLKSSSRILKLEKVAPPAEVARMLRLDPNERVWLCERLRLAGAHPVGIHSSYLAVSGLDLSGMTEEASLYGLLAEAGKPVFRADETIEAVAASAYEAGQLGVPINSPLLLVTRTTYSEDGDPVEVVYARYRNDVYRYSLSLRVGGPGVGAPE
jgi:GntR family transcriptional regulator